LRTFETRPAGGDQRRTKEMSSWGIQGASKKVGFEELQSQRNGKKKTKKGCGQLHERRKHAVGVARAYSKQEKGVEEGKKAKTRRGGKKRPPNRQVAGLKGSGPRVGEGTR